jgi:integration host factor subunit beta
MSQTKAALIATVALETKLSIGLAEAIVNRIFSAMTETLVRGDGIEIRGFGTFTVRSYGAYQGRNPRTGAPTPVKAKRLAFFKVGKRLRERIEAGRLAAE